MTLNTKVKLCVLGDLMLLLIVALFVPHLWLKLVLALVPTIDLVFGLRRWGHLLGNRTGYAEIYEYEEDDLFDDEQDELTEQEEDTTY